MNKKGKNKKGKLPNPSPSQEETGEKLEDLGVIGDSPEKISEITQNVEEKVESVKEERVPEIISETIASPVETKDEETPKKPKRNRGKKKKGKEDDFDNNIEECQKESGQQASTEEEKVDEVKEELSKIQSVTPTARKKKNKKKNIEQKTETKEQFDPEPQPVPSKTSDYIDSEIKEVKPETIIQTDPVEQEIKPSKKKNKKKKRNDSEKSDKEEITCTSSFQKLLDDKVKPLEENVKEKTDDKLVAVISEVCISENQPKMVTTQTEVPTDKDIFINPLTPTKVDEVPQIPLSDSKNKKKNNKEKKHIPKLEESGAISKNLVKASLPPENEALATEDNIMTTNIAPTTNITSLDITEMKTTGDWKKSEFLEKPATLATDIAQLEKSESSKAQDCTQLKDEVSAKTSLPFAKDEKRSKTPDPLSFKDTVSLATILKPTITKDVATLDKPDIMSKESSPKPKAKIAKPVEKKRKGKTDSDSPENIEQNIIISEPIQTEKLIDQVQKEESEIKEENKETISDDKVKNSEKDLSTNVASQPLPESSEKKEIFVLDYEPLNISDKITGKKKKKGSKTPKSDFEFEAIKLSETIAAATIETSQPEKNFDVRKCINKEEVSIEEEIKISQTTEKVIHELKPTVDVMPGPKQHILLTPETEKKSDPLKQDTLMPKNTGDIDKSETKLSKKRKKSPKPPKKTEDVQKPNLEKSVESPLPKESGQSKATASENIDASNITKMYDIEITSIKADESEGSICDVTPDITYPPRCSSQQLPDNNNNNNTIIREMVAVKPITADIISVKDCSSTLDIGKNETSPQKEEKTDIKSKMMEVNQDMEELRLSIERSLAELTAIEKTEEFSEKQFELDKQSKEQFTKNADIVTTQKTVEKEKQEVFLSSLVAQSSSERSREHENKEPEKQQITLSEVIEAKAEKKSDVSDTTAKKTDTKSMKSDSKRDAVAVEAKIIELLLGTDKNKKAKTSTEKEKIAEMPPIPLPFGTLQVIKPDQKEEEKESETKLEIEPIPESPPVCPSRKDQKNKHKKKKGKQEAQVTTPQTSQSAQSTTTSQSSTTQETTKDEKSDSKKEDKSESKEPTEKSKQQASGFDQVTEKDLFSDIDYEPIDNFEDALTSSVDDVNKTFEMIVQESQDQSNPTINIIAPPDEEKSTVSPPKNLLGHPDIPVPSNKRDYKKEKDKIPNEITAKVKIKDSEDVERKQSKNTQTIHKLKDLKDCKVSDNEEFVYKYNFRKVFLQSACHICKKDLSAERMACCYCNLVFYCGIKHKEEDWPQHQAMCFAVSTIGHLKDQKHIYADAKNITGHDYRLVRMQMIVSCEKILKRRLVPWEQESLLYPRICAHIGCREWRQMLLSDCQGCGQISFCTNNPDHLPKNHSRWCKSYNLYQKLVCYQQTNGRLEPKLPTKVMQDQYYIPEKINEVLAGMYEEKIDMNDIQYAALTQLATAPLTTAYCHQLCKNKNIISNGYKKSSFVIHVVGAELQFEADALNKWEVFFLHLRPDLQELKVVLVNYNLNPSNLPLELLGRIKLCHNCRQNNRRVIFDFQDKRTYPEYKSSEDFVIPDIICAFNPSIQRSSIYNGKDPWPTTVNAILKQKIPFIVTGYTLTELRKDCIRIKECSDTGFNFISEPKYNNYASVRPDRNFISDDEMPLLFKNYCFTIISG